MSTMSLKLGLCRYLIKCVGFAILLATCLIVGYTTAKMELAVPITITATAGVGILLIIIGTKIDKQFFVRACPICHRQIFAPTWHCKACNDNRPMHLLTRNKIMEDSEPEDHPPHGSGNRNGQASKSWFSPG